jgi:hypothetical protein
MSTVASTIDCLSPIDCGSSRPAPFIAGAGSTAAPSEPAPSTAASIATVTRASTPGSTATAHRLHPRVGCPFPKTTGVPSPSPNPQPPLNPAICSPAHTNGGTSRDRSTFVPEAHPWDSASPSRSPTMPASADMASMLNEPLPPPPGHDLRLPKPFHHVFTRLGRAVNFAARY